MATKTQEPKVGKELIKKNRFREQLKCDLTDDEIREASENMAESFRAFQQLENDRKALNDEFKAKTSEAEARVKRFSTLVNNKHEYRQVEVEEVRDLGKKTLTITRLDTNEVVKERALEEWELQTEIPGSNGESSAAA